MNIPASVHQIMNSQDISELTGKRHADVLRDIKNLVKRLYKIDGASLHHEQIQGVTFHFDNRAYVSRIDLDKDHTMTLITGYEPKLRFAVNKRWRELEEGQYKYALPQIPDQVAVSKLEAHLKAYALLGAPLHYAQIEAVKYVRNATGVDYSVALTYSPAQNNIQPEEVMLEPTELGKRHGISAIALNRLLADHGYQKKSETGWEPTELGKAYCEKHSWSKKSKSGYNLKWREDLIDSLINSETAMS